MSQYSVSDAESEKPQFVKSSVRETNYDVENQKSVLKLSSKSLSFESTFQSDRLCIDLTESHLYNDNENTKTEVPYQNLNIFTLPSISKPATVSFPTTKRTQFANSLKRLKAIFRYEKAVFSSAIPISLFLTTILIVNYTQGYILTQLPEISKPTTRTIGEIDHGALLDMGALSTEYIRIYGEFYRLFWSMLLHKDLVHLLLNVLCQLQILHFLSKGWGFFRLLGLYFFSGVTGNLISATLNPCSISVGCSGAVFGLLASTLIFCSESWNFMKGALNILILNFVILAISFLFSLNSKTDNWAHLGGMLGGLLYSSLTLHHFHSSCPFRMAQNYNPGRPMTIQEHSSNSFHFFNSIKKINWSFKMDLKILTCIEWMVRVLALIAILVLWIRQINLLFVNYEYEPVGQLALTSIRSCCCCYISDNVKSIQSWMCLYCDIQMNKTLTWKGFCDQQALMK